MLVTANFVSRQGDVCDLFNLLSMLLGLVACLLKCPCFLPLYQLKHLSRRLNLHPTLQLTKVVKSKLFGSAVVDGGHYFKKMVSFEVRCVCFKEELSPVVEADRCVLQLFVVFELFTQHLFLFEELALDFVFAF